MKKQVKGILAFLFLGGIMVTSGVVIAFPGVDPVFDPNADPDMNATAFTVTGTPADNFPDADRPTFCGSSDAKSTTFVREFSIPTMCTNPLAIATDYDRNVWFAETNTGVLAKFDPVTETFTEYDNPMWPAGARSMMWGMDYAPDGAVWYTDESSVWKFSTIDEEYERIPYPSQGNSLPQRLLLEGSQIIINDFNGNKITFLDPNQSGQNVNYLSVPSPNENFVTGDFAVDADDNVWFTNWLYPQGGALVKFDQAAYLKSSANFDPQFGSVYDFIQNYTLPMGLLAPNGAAFDGEGTLWLADTASSSFFSFDPVTETFTHYVTSDPLLSTFGNQTGVVKTPISRPYWIESDDRGRIVFNEQNANNLSVFDPVSQSLVQYHVPSKNPNWGDCDPGTGIMLADCGVAQIFDFTIDGERIWFTEWVENNIGVVDTSIPLPFEIGLESDRIGLTAGASQQFSFTVNPMSGDAIQADFILSSTHDFLTVDTGDGSDSFLLGSSPRSVQGNLTASENALPGTYKVLIGAQSPEVGVGKYVTVTVQ